MIRKLRKGFTIVELVIVIAVIAVLTAVLIPTFIHLSKKAKLASDNSLVSNLNTALKMDRGENHPAPKTMQDAVDAVERQGYLVPQLATKSEQKLVYSIEKNEFCLSDKVAEGEEYKYWHIEKGRMPDNQLFSIYAYQWTETAATNLTVGFDAGKEVGITTVSFVRGGGADVEAREVVIRTNSPETALTINAPKDTVHHYDYLDELTVTAVASASYHEHGVVRGKAVINKGHIVVESGSSVPEVSVESATGSVKVTANERTLINVDSASSSQASVVANSKNIYVSGVSSDKISGPKASSVELPTVVTSESELAAAISAEKAFIQLGANFTAAEIYSISSETLIDFAGYVITATKIGTTQEQYAAAITGMTEGFIFNNTPFLTNNSSLTLADTKGNGGISSSNNIVVLNKSSLVINGGALSGNLQIHKYYSGTGAKNELSEAQKAYRTALNGTLKRGLIRNEANAKLVVNSVNLYTKSDYGVLNYGIATINGGTFRSDSSSSNGGYAYCVTNNNTMTINGGVVNGDHGAIGGNAGSLVINNVTAKAKQYYGLYAAGEIGVASAVINNGVFESEKQSAVLVGNSSDGGLGLPANVTINNGTFKGSTVSGSNAAVRSTETAGGGTYGLGFVTINGGRFNTNVSNANGVKTCVQVDGLWVVNK